uniref:beta-glucosidase n=1 Tax=Oryza rufipogon TaxID=4529 RepID=A0A0E0N323_ORYRU
MTPVYPVQRCALTTGHHSEQSAAGADAGRIAPLRVSLLRGMICPKISLACVLLLLWFTSTGDAAYMKYLDPKQPTNTRIKDLISRMTLAEKIGQMTQIERGVASADVMKNYFIGSVLSGGGSVPAPQATPAVWVNMVNEFQKGALSTRLGIPMIYGIDAVHGGSAKQLLLKYGQQAFRTPLLHVCRDPRWGRCYESYSEDHRVVQQMTDIILGLQGDIPINHTKGVPYIAGKDKVAACAKHFVGDGGTHNGINENNTITDEHGLLGIHMPPYYDSIIKGVATVMVSYSSLNGVKMHANHDLGFVISDWLGIDRITSPPDANYTYSVQAGINAGIDMVMVPFNYTQYIDDVTSLVKKGIINMSRIDDAVRPGSHASNLGYQCGGWSIEWIGGSGDITVGTTILEAIKSTVADSTHVVYSENPDESFMKNNDFSFAIVVVGERTYAETTAWLPGTEGQGVADVLFGDYGFTGKLPRTWFKSVDQLPMNVGDLHYDPLFPFGFGLTINSSQPGFSGADRLRDRNGGMIYVVLSLVLSVILMHASGIGIF